MHASSESVEKRLGKLLSHSDNHQAYVWSRTRKGAWGIAQSPILTTTIALERLGQHGYESIIDDYLKVRPEQSIMGISFTS